MTANGLDLLRQLADGLGREVVRDRDVEFLFERHHELDLVERVGTEVFLEARLGLHEVGFDAEAR